jgi:hypothetical protein
MMRVDKIPPRQVYQDFFDWLNRHPIWLINIFLAMLYYLMTTEEV